MTFLARILMPLGLMILLLGGLTRPAGASPILWYNGDFDGRNGLGNAVGGADQRVFDDFIVTDPAGWTIDRIWSNNLIEGPGVATADWSIRSGVSPGNGGTVIASGVSPATQTATGRSGFALTEFTIEVGGLNVFLAPGTYWLQVTPVVGGLSFITTTSGANSVGSPPGNNGNSFVDVPSSGINFQPVPPGIASPADFSMGVGGVVGPAAVPEPSTLALTGLGMLGIFGWIRRRKRTG